MTSTQNLTRNPKAVRDYDAAAISLTHAHQLLETLTNALPTSNPYLIDAYQHAVDLVAEMEADLDDVMSRWSPAECGMDD